MALLEEHIHDLVDVTSELDANGNPQAFRVAFVPAGEVWYLASLSLRNTTAGALSPIVWIVPPQRGGDGFAGTTAQWQEWPGTGVAANATGEKVPAVPARTIRRLVAGTSIWLKCSAVGVNLIARGWRTRVLETAEGGGGARGASAGLGGSGGGAGIGPAP
ncbi:MAG TPA: hypothetical protein DCQ64_15855 [Candidatus Rokubacteria bacterium]|nr:hypothetical protein [Candidatus Rokubacteria bacterium]